MKLLGLLTAVMLASCRTARPSSVTAEAAVGHACYGADCGPNGELRVSATWEISK